MSTITITLRETNLSTRSPCAVCGHEGHKSAVIAEGSPGIVCIDCLDAGPEAVAGTLYRRADDLEARRKRDRADRLRRLAEARWVLPSVAELHEREGYACP